MFQILKLYLFTQASGLKIPFFELRSICKRHKSAEFLIGQYSKSEASGLSMSISELESHEKSGGDIAKLIDALALAKRLKLELSVEKAKAFDLEGIDIQNLVNMKITPQVTAFPAKNQTEKTIVKGDLIISWRAYITIRLKNFELLKDSESNSRLLEQVKLNIEEAVNQASAAELLQNPSAITQKLLELKDQIDSPFELISIELIARKQKD